MIIQISKFKGIDIRDFERRLKSSRSIKHGQDSSSDDDFDGGSNFGRSFMSSKSNISQSSAAQMKSSIQNKLQKIKQNEQKLKTIQQTAQQTSQNKKILKKYDDPELESIMKSQNIEQKVKELLNKYQQLQKNFDRERNLRVKYENEHVSQNRTRLEETSTNTTQYQTSKLGKTSILSAINQNEIFSNSNSLQMIFNQNIGKHHFKVRSLKDLKRSIEERQNAIRTHFRCKHFQYISQKATGNTSSSSNGFKVFEDSKTKRLENELKIMKKERDEFFASRFDKKNAELVKDLSYQNSKMRVKIEELEQMTKNK